MNATYFAPAKRSDADELRDDIKIITESSLISTLMNTIGGLLAILDEHRQIVALNQALLDSLGISRVEDILGCRPGEAIGCIHAHEAPNGCGTTKSCRTCGAVIAIISSLQFDKPVEDICIAEVEKNGIKDDLYLGVRAAPMTLSGRRFVLLFLQDLSAQHKLATLERVFFHDMNNALTGLLGYVELLKYKSPDLNRKAVQMVTTISQNVYREVALQQALSTKDFEQIELKQEEVSPHALLEELCDSLKQHGSALGKKIIVAPSKVSRDIITDRYLIIKILTNMMLNALEASEKGGSVAIAVEQHHGCSIFSVHNSAVIPGHIQNRIFTKNFSTKEKHGRGLGTFSMKLFSEKLLGAKLYFTSEEDSGTYFFLEIPC